MSTYKILLTKGQSALVDEVDYANLSQWKWCAIKIRDKFYAVRRSRKGEYDAYKFIYMHRQILGLKPGDSGEVDHANRDTLDNRRDNLRRCSHQENMLNKTRPNKTGYRGVSLCSDQRRRKKYFTKIVLNGKIAYMGYFETAEAAHAAYCENAKRIHGAFYCAA